MDEEEEKITEDETELWNYVDTAFNITQWLLMILLIVYIVAGNYMMGE